MQQPNENTRIINLEPVGGGKVSEEKFNEAVYSIIGAVKSLRGDSAATDTGTSQPVQQDPKPQIAWAKIKRYGLYAGGTITAIYLMGKALE